MRRLRTSAPSISYLDTCNAEALGNLDESHHLFKDNGSNQDHLFHILTLLEEGGVKRKPNKCFFSHRNIIYLHPITPRGTRAVSQQAKATRVDQEELLPTKSSLLKSLLYA